MSTQTPFVGMVKIAVVGRKTVEIAFEGDQISLEDALNQAYLTANNHTVSLKRGNNRTDVDPVGLMLHDEDKVFLIPQIRGGQA